MIKMQAVSWSPELHNVIRSLKQLFTVESVNQFHTITEEEKLATTEILSKRTKFEDRELTWG